ncbi:alcohol dehydrogenase class IV [Acetoanaerobium pronyense]|uniref:Alcohol dehydrogenase class IV n=1 Tax=Acetoanaerobium pronyense TaxID=1482736 RepID=A0ABS4KK38_9FIRM|nr:1-propanol dehydrogenase PduQ [Acetoanaerobium pronyense]MBP2028158.1 alcohol dehydrogenase class IV [Acetoanaerobium pronyense]
MHTFGLKTQILSGEGSLEYIETLNVNSVCIVTDMTMIKIGALARIAKVLDKASIKYRIFDSVEADPSLDTVRKGLNHIIENKPDALIAVGGGSVIDAAKAIMFFCIKTKEELVHKSEIHKPLFIAIPTTSGTGSEVTSFSVITDYSASTKIPLTDPLMLPDIAILDAGFTLSVPPFVTADTGMDVITHALEAYVSNSAGSFSDVYAEKALDLALKNLITAYEKGSDVKARQNMHDASCMAGIAFTNAGLGINHSLAHAIGGRFKISHGRANAILMPHIISFNSGLLDKTTEIYGEKYDQIAKKLGLNLATREERIIAFIELIKKLNEIMGIQSSFRAYGINENDFIKVISEMANSALGDICTDSNPKKATKFDLEKLLKLAFQ